MPDMGWGQYIRLTWDGDVVHIYNGDIVKLTWGRSGR